MAGSSIERVELAAKAANLPIFIQRMDQSTRTAQEAADACGCMLDQIVKSLIFEGAETGALKLLLVAGGNRIDMALAPDYVGEGLIRADPRLVRERTGFAIGGVAPIGHLQPIDCFMDRKLLDFTQVWAAAGRPDSVFRVDPHKLLKVTGATVVDS